MQQQQRVPATDGIPPEDETMPVRRLFDASEEEAELQGYWAYCFGCELDANPYVGTDWSKAWRRGWMDSADNCEG